MNVIKGFLTLFLLSFALVAQGTTFSLAFDGTSGSNLVSTAVQVYDLTVTAGATDSVTVRFYDTTYNHAVWTNSSYTTRAAYMTNIVLTATNDYSQVTTKTNYMLYTYSSTVAASTNNTYSAFATITVPAGGQVTAIGPFNCVRGVTAIPTTNCTINGSYKSLR